MSKNQYSHPMSIRVLHIIDHLGLGGAQTFLRSLLEYERTDKNIEMYCAALRPAEHQISINSQDIFICPSKSKFSLVPLFFLKNLIQKYNINVLHCHLLRSQVIGWLLKIFYFKNLKLVFHEHGQIMGVESNYLIEGLLFPLFLRLAGKTDTKFLAVSNSVKQILVKKVHLKEESVSEFKNFTEISRFTLTKSAAVEIQEFKRTLDISENNFIFGFAGRLIHEKGWETLANAFKIISNAYPNSQCIFVGHGPETLLFRKWLNRQDTEVRKKIILIDHIESMSIFYHSLNCFIITSHAEAFGLTALEAMASFVPIIASDIPGLNEILTNKVNALMIPPKNIPALSSAMAEIITDKTLRNSLIKNGSEIVKSYDIAPYMERLCAYYKSLN